MTGKRRNICIFQQKIQVEKSQKKILENTITENYKKYCQRLELYKSFGYDVEAERKIIIDKSYPLSGDILEVGTGKGYFTLALAKEGCNFTSIDISEQEQNFAKLNIKYHGLDGKVNFKIANAQKLPFENQRFNIVFCVNTFHHLGSPLEAIDELVRVVSLEGKIILSDFNKQGLKLVDKIHHSEGSIHEVGIFDLNYIAKYLLDKGFKLKKYARSFQDLLIVQN